MSETAMQVVARIRNEQRLSYRITPLPDSLLPADSLGGQLTALSDLFRELGKRDGLRLKTLISRIATDDDGSITFDLVIANLAE